MTRIIAGRWGGRRIAVPPRGTRPTTDRVREAVFSRLDHADALRGARVLDLFAGSGALGLEALSRGAAHATLVEADGRAAAVLKANVRELSADATVCKERVSAYLARPGNHFDLVLLDPPYDIPRGELDTVLGAVAQRIAPTGTVVLEWSARAGDPPWPPALVADGSKAYGETAVHYAVPRDGAGVSPDSGSVDA